MHLKAVCRLRKDVPVKPAARLDLILLYEKEKGAKTKIPKLVPNWFQTEHELF